MLFKSVSVCFLKDCRYHLFVCDIENVFFPFFLLEGIQSVLYFGGCKMEVF